MALPSTVLKAKISISDLVRGYYADHQLTIAQHPSENEIRVLVRMIAFIHNASERLQFGRGISTDEDADIWEKNDHGDVDLWVELGLPEEKEIKKLSSKSEKVRIYAYSDPKIQAWMIKNRKLLSVWDNVEFFRIGDSEIEAAMPLMARNMDWSVIVQEEGEMTLSSVDHNVDVRIERLTS